MDNKKEYIRDGRAPIPKNEQISKTMSAIMTRNTPPNHGSQSAVPKAKGSPSFAAFAPVNSKEAARRNSATEKPATTTDMKAANSMPFSRPCGSPGTGSGKGASSGCSWVRTMM